MAVTAEQFVQGLRQRGIRLDLAAVEPEPRFRLTGPKEQITERIREYIRRHRAEISALFGQCRCYECWSMVDEYDDSTYQMVEDKPYCIRCWQALTKPAPEPWQLEAQAFLDHALNDLDFSLFGPFTEQRVTHIPTGRTWQPETTQV